MKIFISYARKDIDSAKKLNHDLKKAGLTPWLDVEELLPGEKWRSVIPQTLRESRFCLMLLSSESLTKRGYIQKELKMALDILDEFPPEDIFAIPVRLDDCTPKDDRLRDLHFVDLFPSYEKGFKRILRVFRHEDEAISREIEVEEYIPAQAENRGFSVKGKDIQGVIQAGSIQSVEQHFYGIQSSLNENRSEAKEPAESKSIEELRDEETTTAHILHLSDLHFGTEDDARLWYSQLAEDLNSELNCHELDALILSGDVANKSEPEEYKAAKIFLDCLSSEFGLTPSQLAIVPGNHDLNWTLSKKGYRLMDREDYDGELKEEYFIKVDEEVIRVRDDDKYKKRFQHFCEFYKDIKDEPYSLDYAEQGTLYYLPYLNILILGLNSTWDTDHYFKSRASIHPGAIAQALDQIRKNEAYKNTLKFAVWHHPLNSGFEDRITDHGFMERLAQAGFSVCFHGHIHKSNADLYRYDIPAGGRRIEVVGAGTFGAPIKAWTPGFPLEYNLLKITGRTLTVETRCRRELKGAWKPEAIWSQGPGKDPLPRYTIDLPGAVKTPPPPPPEPRKPTTSTEPVPTQDQDFEKEINVYRTKAENLFGKLPLTGFKTRLRVPIRIEEVYVPLRAMIDFRGVGDACFADSEDAEKCLRKAGIDREISIPDAFQYTEKMNRRGIVILGDPGSGKTTHLKRLLLWCLQGGLAKLGLPENIIPVFLPLLELKDLTKGIDAFIQDQLDRPHLETPDNFGKKLLNRGNLLFLFDGLDEVAEPEDRVQVSRWIEEALEAHSSCRFVVTCRFAGYTPEARLNEEFLEMHMRPFDEEQAETFIYNWYKTVETGLSTDADQARIIAEEKAKNLIERLQQPEFRARRVFELTRNPLLLTNLCLVHRDRGNLPHTRAKLYEECTDVLLELWRGAIGFPGKITAQTGRRVLQPAALWMHQEENRTRAKADELAPVIEPALKAVGWPYGSAGEFLKAVRDESGLLTGWDQENYGFMHLGFQEYLAAREIRNQAFTDPSVLQDLSAHFGKSWWQEVTLLMLALEEPSLFIPFMKEVVRQPSFAQHTDLVEACLDDAAEVSVEPFLELVKTDPQNNQNLWKNQLTALRVMERLDASQIESIAPLLRKHPYGKIHDWIRERTAEALQDVIHAQRGGYELVRIPGGSFFMGSPETEEGRDQDESPLHEVHVADFYIGRYPVTNIEYGRFLEDNPKSLEPEYWADRNFNQPQQPVVGVSWHDAKQYAEWAGLRLPTEAEWEYACRAGTTTRYYTGDSGDDLDRAGWYDKNSGGKLHPVGEKEPNAFGLYDMHGNVWEWIEDDRHGSYKDATDDGRAWIDTPRGGSRVIRGGSWGNTAGNCRSAFRYGYGPVLRVGFLGFRLSKS